MSSNWGLKNNNYNIINYYNELCCNLIKVLLYYYIIIIKREKMRTQKTDLFCLLLPFFMSVSSKISLFSCLKLIFLIYIAVFQIKNILCIS